MKRKLIPVSGRVALRKLQKAGFVKVHQKGSHIVMKNYDIGKIVVIPMHGAKDICSARLQPR